MEPDGATPSFGMQSRLFDETAKSLPHADRTAPSEGVAAITATAPSIVLEGDPSGSADIADARPGFLDSAVAAFVVDLRLESPRGLFRIPRERETGEIVALGQNVLCLPEQRPDLRRVQVVRLSFLEDRFACDENRSSFLDLRLAKLDRPFNLLLLALHREPFGPFEQVARMAMLARGNRLSGRGMKLLGFPHLRADIPGEFDVARYGPDRILHVPNPARPGVVRALGGFQEALPCRPETTPVQEVGPALPCVLRESDRRTEVRGLASRFRACASKSPTRSKSTEESRPRIRPASRSAGACASSSIRISDASGALARASTRSHFFLRPWRLTRCRSPRSRSCRGRSRPRRYSIRRRSASTTTASGSGNDRRVSIRRVRSAWRPRSMR